MMLFRHALGFSCDSVLLSYPTPVIMVVTMSSVWITSSLLSSSRISTPVMHILKTRPDLFLEILNDVSVVPEETHCQLGVLLAVASRRCDTSSDRNAFISQRIR